MDAPLILDRMNGMGWTNGEIEIKTTQDKARNGKARPFIARKKKQRHGKQDIDGLEPTWLRHKTIDAEMRPSRHETMKPSLGPKA